MYTTEVSSTAPSHLQRKTRDASLDNIRFLLIFSVVTAHLLEVCAPFAGSETVYQVIYTFHMPAFIFLFGYNIKYSPGRIIFCWCLPYVVFQTLYLAFSRGVLHNQDVFQYTTPYWLLWFMLACIYYQLLLPLYDTDNRRRQTVAVVCVYFISLLIGYDDSVGYYMSLSRFFVFQPWFLLGYYCKKNSRAPSVSAGKKMPVVLSIAAAAVVVLSLPFLRSSNISNGLLYGSLSYAACASALWMRAVLSLIALSWVILLFAVIKPHAGRKLPFITTVGQYSWPIFLLHGFALRVIPLYWPELLASPRRVVLTACALLFLLGNKAAYKAVTFISFSWLEKYTGR